MFVQRQSVQKYKCAKCYFIFFTLEPLNDKSYCPKCGDSQNVGPFPKKQECKKKKYTKAGAMTWLAKAYYKRHILGDKKRKECRYYYCDSCKAFHVTSKEETKQ